MANGSRITFRHIAAVLASGMLLFGIFWFGVKRELRERVVETELQGAVLRQDSDPQKQIPLAGVSVASVVGGFRVTTLTDASGLFRISVPTYDRIGRTWFLHFSDSGYADARRVIKDPKQILIVRMIPDPELESSKGRHPGPSVSISNPRIRYTVRTESFIDVGAIVRTFTARNQGNSRCDGGSLCSPDGEWKAGEGSLTVEAGEGNYFRNLRVSCIAGPCPFTRVEAEELREGGRVATIRAVSWSDTATFLVEADVVHVQRADMVRISYPLIHGNGLSFNLPPGAQGPSVEAELNRQSIVFPLGPKLILSWADCTSKRSSDGLAFSCSLKPGYRFE